MMLVASVRIIRLSFLLVSVLMRLDVVFFGKIILMLVKKISMVVSVWVWKF